MWIKNKVLLFAFIFSTTLLFGGSVRIFNDSSYELKAVIMSADGKTQGSITIPPQQQSQWQDFSGANATWSQTPYTVTFFCKSGKQFGIIRNIGQGATVSALAAIGSLSCDDDKKDSKQSDKTQTPQIEMPFNPDQQPFNPNQTPFDPTPNQGGASGKGQNQQGQSGNQGGSGSSDPFGPADPHGAPGDPIWGPP